MGSRSSRSSKLVDVVLIAIDFENFSHYDNGYALKSSSQLGLAILDTKEINEVSPDKLISTYNFVWGSPSYYRRKAYKFSFGETIKIRYSEIADRIQSLIPRARNIVFVGHSVCQEIRALRILGFQFPVLLSAILDTAGIGKDILGHWMSLSQLLLRLECSFDNRKLHCAGNDAAFTLKALLLLAARGFSKQEQDLDGDCNMTDVLQQISNYPKPQSRTWTWDQEKIDEIRAARKQKREDEEICLNAFALIEPS